MVGRWWPLRGPCPVRRRAPGEGFGARLSRGDDIIPAYNTRWSPRARVEYVGLDLHDIPREPGLPAREGDTISKSRYRPPALRESQAPRGRALATAVKQRLLENASAQAAQGREGFSSDATEKRRGGAPQRPDAQAKCRQHAAFWGRLGPSRTRARGVFFTCREKPQGRSAPITGLPSAQTWPRRILLAKSLSPGLAN